MNESEISASVSKILHEKFKPSSRRKHWHCPSEGPLRIDTSIIYLQKTKKLLMNHITHENECGKDKWMKTLQKPRKCQRTEKSRRTFTNFTETLYMRVVFIAASSASRCALLRASTACECSRVHNDAKVTGRFGGRPAGRHVWHWVLYNVSTTSVPVVRTTRQARVATIYFGSGQCTYRTQPWDLRVE